MRFNDLSHKIIGCAIEVHKALGPGLLESTYEKCLARELALNNLAFKTQLAIPVNYKGIQLECGYRIDILVERKVVLELKSVEELSGIHEAQLITYLKLTRKSHGLLINFNVKLLKNGIKSYYFDNFQ